jgi:DNA-binding SARP family transcriptional activator/Flp pilus assembly protein TadD
MIQLRTLGVLDLRSGDDEAIRQVLAQPKRAALLAYLVLATPGGSHPRDKLLALFWPDQAPEPARNALSQAVHFLRRALGDAVIVSQNGDALGVAPSLIGCDAITFDDAIRQGRIEEALELYRGDFLEGFHVANAPDFERWVDAERQRLAERFDAALETIATRCEQQGDHAAALTFRRRLAARAPYNSAVTLKLMRALAASGDPAAAVQHAQIHEKLLRSELDVPLPAEITAFVAELQSRPVRREPSAGSREPVAESREPVAESREPRAESREPVTETDLRELQSEQSDKPTRLRSRRIAILTVALVTVSVGVAAAFVGGSRDSDRDELMALYERGRSVEVNRSLVGVQTAAQLYRLAIARDSGFALGFAALARNYQHMAHYDFAPKGPILDSARILAQRAVALDSMLPEARTALAASLASSGYFAAAEREYLRAIELGPSNPEARTSYGMLLVSLSRGHEALAQAERAQELDPLGPRLAQTIKTNATYLITGQRPELKLPPAERRPILKVETGEPWARAQQAVELADDGRCAEARSDLSLAQRLVPDSNMVMLAFAGLVHVSCGDRPQARTLLARMKQRSNVEDHAVRVAMLHTAFAEKDSAFAWLNRHRWILSEFGLLTAGQWLDPLRSDPRFPQLMRRLGIK